jgi:hypothetical protein
MSLRPRLPIAAASRPPFSVLSFSVGIWFLLAIFAVRDACAQAAAEAPAPFTFGAGDCPDPAAVEREVLRLIPPERHELLRRGVRIELDDLGESYRVTVSKDGTFVKKNYADPARDCDGRARFAAVFAVLTVMPPELGPDELAPKPPPPPPAPPLPVHVVVVVPPPAPPLAPLAHIEVAALFGYAPAIVSAPQLTTFGGELRVALGRGALAGTLSIAYLSHAKFELDGVHGELSQLPASAGLRANSEVGSWNLAADLGVLAVLQRIRATDLARSNTDTALELGARGGLMFEREIGSGFAPFFGAFAWFVPAPRDLSALPQGTLGNLPYLWIGGTLGVALGL